ncbi:hypothetical protein LTR53_001104 [Teratosphaeriaceae sp. CCFEE 6253]|nr:hypothetical protein LTR53_001104 [Teratosphaeriaceae sp. CCFEE 6253]
MMIHPKDILDETGNGHDDDSIKESSLEAAHTPSTPEKAHPDERPEQPRTDGPPPPPNGGYGWVCTACAALINAHTWGLNSSYGVFLAHYLATNTFPGATSLEYAFVGSLSISCALLVSPFATLTTRLYGTRTTLFTGIAFETASLIGASFASAIWQLFLSQGICFGIGMGFLFVGSVGIVPQWFSTKRSLANGFAAGGSGIGGLIYSLATGAMIKSIGLPWAFRVLGIVACVVNSICAILIKDRNKIIGASQLAFDVKLFKRVEYVLINGYGFFSLLAYVVLIFSLASYANAIGLNASQAAVVSAVLNLGQAFGRPPIGYFSDSIGRINMAGLMTFLSGLFALVIWTFTHSYGVLIFYAIIGGTVAGTYWATIAPVTAEVVGLKHVSSALSLIWLFIVLPSTFSEPIALEIVAGTGSYLGTQLFTGFMYMAAAACLLLLRGWKIGELDEIARLKDRSVEEADAVGAEAEEIGDLAKAAGRVSMIQNCLKWRKIALRFVHLAKHRSRVNTRWSAVKTQDAARDSIRAAAVTMSSGKPGHKGEEPAAELRNEQVPPLLRLAPELRNKIYAHLMPAEPVILLHARHMRATGNGPAATLFTPSLPPLTQVCSLIRDEFPLLQYYAGRSFLFSQSMMDLRVMDAFIATRGPLINKIHRVIIWADIHLKPPRSEMQALRFSLRCRFSASDTGAVTMANVINTGSAGFPSRNLGFCCCHLDRLVAIGCQQLGGLVPLLRAFLKHVSDHGSFAGPGPGVCQQCGRFAGVPAQAEG